MTTVRYARFVLVDVKRGSIAWYENSQEAMKAQDINGGALYDTELDDMQVVEDALRNARKNMGVE